MITPEQRAEWREEATRYARGEAMTCDHRILALLAALDESEAENGRLHTWTGLLSLLDEHWPEDVFPTLTDDPARDTGPRLIAALRRLDAANVAADQITEWRKQEAAENARLRALLAEDVALLEELDAAWGGAGGAG